VTYFVDRRDGAVWCDVCAPAQVGLLAREIRTARPKRRLILQQLKPRFIEVAEPVSVAGVGVSARCTMALRCSECGAVQS
jgi:hypothetical protein